MSRMSARKRQKFAEGLVDIPDSHPRDGMAEGLSERVASMKGEGMKDFRDNFRRALAEARFFYIVQSSACVYR